MIFLSSFPLKENKVLSIMILGMLSGIYLFFFQNFSWSWVNGSMFGWGVSFLLFQKIFFLFASIITFSILIFSFYYMKKEELGLFLNFLFLFFVFMIILTSSINLFTMFIGWEGVGIMSFLLIGTFSSREGAIFSSKKAVFYNRIGDFFFLLLILNEGMSQSFMLKTSNLMMKLTELDRDFMKMIWFLFWISSMMSILVKSAQFFFNPWLTSAMEGPTPVSALLHSSTMVVAGVFFFILFFFILFMNSDLVNWLSFISCLTNFIVSTSAFFHFDCKKIIALSTASQLSFMIFIACLGQLDLAFFHLFSHGFFKALLFLCSGVFIHQNQNLQDIRKKSLQTNKSFFLSCLVLLGSLALMGLPFIGAFFSKHKILTFFFFSNFNVTTVVFYFLSLGFTVAYSFRLFFFMFSFNNQNFMSSMKFSDFSLMNLILPLSILILSVILGSWFVGNLFLLDYILVIEMMKWSTLTIIMLGWLLFFLTFLKKKNYMVFHYFFISNWNRVFFFFLKLISKISSIFIEINFFNFFFKKTSMKMMFLNNVEKNTFTPSLLIFSTLSWLVVLMTFFM